MKLILAAALVCAFPGAAFGQDEEDPDDESTFESPRGGVVFRRQSRRKSRQDELLHWEYPGWGVVPASSTSPLDDLVAAPGEFLGVFAGGLRSMGSETPGGSLIGRGLSSLDTPSFDHAFYGFADTLLQREAKYFKQLPDFSLGMAAGEDDEDDIDFVYFMRDQQKVLTHALGRYYLSPYTERLRDGLRKEAFDLSRWSVSDYVVGPAVVAGVLYLHGWDAGLHWGDVDFGIHVAAGERIRRHVRSADDYLIAGASLEIGVQSFPLKLLVSGGVLDGETVLDFVGIGTSIAAARKAVKLGTADPDRSR